MDIYQRGTIIGREIIYTENFESELAALEPDGIRADDFVSGVCHRVARFPESGRHATENVWAFPLTDVDGYPPCALYYTFNENYVWMISIRESDHDPDIEFLTD